MQSTEGNDNRHQVIAAIRMPSASNVSLGWCLRRLLICAACLPILGIGVSLPAQILISARASLIHYVDGKVYLDDQPLQYSLRSFTHLEPGQRLATGQGQAEVLLLPTAFLRIGAQTEVEMLTEGVENSRLRLISGSAMIDVVELLATQQLAMDVGDTTVRFLRKGLYRVDYDPPGGALTVLRGEARTTHSDRQLTLLRNQVLAFDQSEIQTLSAADIAQQDALDAWNEQRQDDVKIARGKPKRITPPYEGF